MATSCVAKAKTAFAEETGVIAALTERNIMTGNPSYPLRRVREKPYDTSMGHNPRTVRVSTVPPPRSAYVPMLPEGNEAKTFDNPLTGGTIDGFGDKTGRGCNLPGDRIQFGYEEFQRCLRGTALETDPICVMDVIEKKGVAATIIRLRTDLPRYAKEFFGNEILDQVVNYSTNLYSIAPGFPTSTGTNSFPAIPTGGASIGFIRLIENVLRHEGWDEGADTPVVNGRPALQVYMGRDSVEFAITQRKEERGLVLNTTITADDKTFGTTEVYEGIQFIENPMPPRGYVVKTGANAYEFRRIPEFIVSAGTEGVVKTINPDYHRSFVNVGGQQLVVVEIGYIIHPRAMERQGLGAMPNLPGKTFKNLFNFEVNLVPDWAIAQDPRCNKDGLYVQYRMTHAYAPLPLNPELMTAFLYIAATPQYIITNPNGTLTTPPDEPVTLEPPMAPLDGGCAVCEDEGPAARMAVSPTCDDLFPANGVGLMRFDQAAYNVSEDGVALTINVERVGGSVGLASVVVTLTEGTATAPENFTAPAGFAGAGPFTKTITWADGVSGLQSIIVPIVSADGDDDGKQFTGSLGTAVGATIGAPSTTTITILDADEAA